MTLSPESSYRTIPLTKGQVSIVDEADFDLLNQWNWYAQYDPHTKGFYARRATRPVPKGPQRIVSMHRLILDLEYGDPRKGDHRNGNTLDNRRSNLRIATNAQNVANTSKIVNKFGHKGISRRPRGVFRVRIGVNNRRIHIGDYPTLELAIAAYRDAALIHHGEFANLSQSG